MAVQLHRARHPEALVAGLARLLLRTPPDPFTPDVVAVPTRGVERYISQSLGRHLGASPERADGVCANVSFQSPAEVVSDALEAAGGIRRGEDPWRPERLAWPILATIDRQLDQPWCRPLARHLGRDAQDTHGADPLRVDRRFALAARLARLFGSYAGQRPEMLVAWSRREDTDGAGLPTPADLSWQPELWRQVRAQLGVPSPAERLGPACEAIAARPDLVDLPDRISIFGPTRLPTDQLRLLRAMGEHREVHLWLTDPSAALWPGGVPGLPAHAAAQPEPRPDEDVQPRSRPSAAASRRARQAPTPAIANPLLRSLGRDAAELRLRLVQELPGITPGSTEPGDAPGVGGPAGDGRGPATLLTRLQGSLRADTALPLPQDDRAILSRSDRSIQAHACHGPTRQAEVLRETILGLLAADETLQPRDILVMCPDLATMAPLISAAFTGADGRLAALRVRIADRTPEQGNEVLATLAQVLAVAPGRLLLSEALDLIARAPVRTRFGFDEADLERIEQLAVRAGVRWGLDDTTRASLQLRGVSAATWSWGLDRMLLGAALSEEGLPLLQGMLPLDDVTTSDLQRIGRLAELIARLARFRDGALKRQPLDAWVALLGELVEGTMSARGSDSWQLPNALGVLAALPQAAGDHAVDVELGLADIRWMLDGALAGRPTRSNFGSGGLTVCGLEPMRSVPHRVVCLVGLDDGVYPRAGRRDGDDMLARDRWIGERDSRSEDRQALLDAILAAGDHLVITFTGADDRTNEPRPPCVPLGELLDVLDGLARSHAGGPARAQILVHHPLQPFDERNFVAEALVPGAPFSHDSDALAAARSARKPRVPPRIGLGVPDAPIDPVTALDLDQLRRFLGSPARSFLRERVGLSMHADTEALPEALPLELGALERWAIGDRAVRELALGRSGEAVANAEHGRGCLPPADPLAQPILTAVGRTAEGISEQLAAARTGIARLVPVRLVLPSGRVLYGSIGDVYDSGIVRGGYSKPSQKHVLDVWPDLLALVASGGSRGTAFIIGNGDTIRVAPPDADVAASRLDELLDLYEAGMASPLPLPIRTASAYAARRRTSSSPIALSFASREWRQERRGEVWGDSTSREWCILLGDDPPFEALLAEPPRTEEAWYPGETSRFGVLARRLWEPVHAGTTVHS